MCNAVHIKVVNTLSPTVNNPADLIAIWLKPLTIIGDTEHPPWQLLNPAPGMEETGLDYDKDVYIGIVGYGDDYKENTRSSPPVFAPSSSFWTTALTGDQNVFMVKSNAAAPSYVKQQIAWTGAIEFANIVDKLIDVQWYKKGKVFCIASQLGNGGHANMLVENALYLGMQRKEIDEDNVYKLNIFSQTDKLDINADADSCKIIESRQDRKYAIKFCMICFDVAGHPIAPLPEFENDCTDPQTLKLYGQVF
jgi:hypothetical protein